MVNNPTSNDIDLEVFLKAAGQSFTDAQKALVPGAEVAVNMMLSTAELELKVSVRSDAKGKMMIRPISSDEISRGAIDPGLLSTVRINFVSTVGELQAQSKPESAPQENAVPSVLGLTMKAAGGLLSSRGWAFEMHAASREEVIAASEGSRGTVLRQLPKPLQTADKKTAVVHIWINLGGANLRDIDGIGPKYEETLSKAGIGSVGELSLANASQVASALRTNESRAQTFIDMAGLMSRLAIAGLRDEVVELLAKGAKVASVEALATSGADSLFKVCREAIAAGRVKVPREFTFTLDDVREWIRTAKSYLGK